VDGQRASLKRDKNKTMPYEQRIPDQNDREFNHSLGNWTGDATWEKQNGWGWAKFTFPMGETKRTMRLSYPNVLIEPNGNGTLRFWFGTNLGSATYTLTIIVSDNNYIFSQSGIVPETPVEFPFDLPEDFDKENGYIEIQVNVIVVWEPYPPPAGYSTVTWNYSLMEQWFPPIMGVGFQGYYLDTRAGLPDAVGPDPLMRHLKWFGMGAPPVPQPPLIIQPSIKDTMIWAELPTNNFGAYVYFYVFINDQYQYVRRCLVQFDFTSLPEGAIITAAHLELYYYAAYGSDPVGRKYWAYELVRPDWVEMEATWNIYKTGSVWTTPGGDYTTEKGSSIIMPASPGVWVSWDVLELVQHFQSAHGKIANFLLRDNNETSYNVGGTFRTREYTTDLSKRPKLVLEYSL